MCQQWIQHKDGRPQARRVADPEAERAQHDEGEAREDDVQLEAAEVEAKDARVGVAEVARDEADSAEQEEEHMKDGMVAWHDRALVEPVELGLG